MEGKRRNNRRRATLSLLLLGYASTMVASRGVAPLFPDPESGVLLLNDEAENGTPGEIRTRNFWFLRPKPLPIGLLGQSEGGET